MKFFRKRSVWVLLTTYILSWFVISLVAGNILNGYSKVINTALGLSGTRTEIIDTDEDVDTEYYKSSFVKKNGEDIEYVTDANGYTHQAYDDAALRAEAEATAEQVQREGTTILWNNSSNGLPLSIGDKVSVFSHSSVDWAESGGGSGVSQVNPNSTVLNEFNNAGLSVNQTLWDFYKTGAGSGEAYTRVGNVGINEVPWSVYTDAVKNSFVTYGDAAIMVFTRTTREASTGGNGGDATKSLADTPTGDYFDMSDQEVEMIEHILQLKQSGTFKKVIALLNMPTGMFMDTLVEHKNEIDCCLWVGMTGYQGLHEVANIMVGKSIPSGHLPDLFPFNTSSAPSSVNVEARLYSNVGDFAFRSKSQQGAYLTYAENIYVGYKYYETRYEDAVLNQGNASSAAGVKNSSGNVWKYKEEVAFPFGHGESYTTFEFSGYSAVLNADGDYDVTVKIKNTGSKDGYEVAQVYVQRPYTQYDKENGIEQASVNLCGYAKTDLLKPNESQTLNITVRSDAFKTYDANNKRTYIREKTSGLDAYYLTVAKNSHNAINNILAAKGKTVANSMGLMDEDGNASFVQKFEFNDDDFETYSVSKNTGNKIENQFDDVDWNKYEHKTENNVTYLSRNDWNGTYPVSTVVLSLNDDMFIDLGDTHEVVTNPNDVMPLYNQTQVYNLVDLIGLDYDAPQWEVLLNQLSIDEQIKLLGSAYFGTIAITSINKPAEVAADGPLGLRKSFLYNSSIKTMSYPSPTVLAASFNDELAKKVGEMMGEEGLHSGTTGLYAPGVNIHRSTYGARNWEYHSEDGFLSGMIGKWRVIGAQSKGCYVNMKHFALNDQESYRHGVGVWCNEQALREVYLSAYEYASTEGACTGFMTAFVRFGTRWSGATKGLCTGVVRNEWGVKGFIVSDSAWQQYMGVVDGVLAGNDCILSNVDLSMYDIAKTNPTVAIAVRESTHRILYVICNSNAMNSFSSGVRIFEVNEWWQILVQNIQVALGVVTGGFVLITVLMFVFTKQIDKEEEENKQIEKDFNESNQDDKTQKPKKKFKFKAILLSSVAATVIAASVTTALLMKDLYPIYDSGAVAVSLREKIEGNPTLHKLEFEDSKVESTIEGLRKDYDGKTAEQTNNPSGTGFISGLSNQGDASFVFYIDSSEAKDAVFGISVGKGENNIKIASMLDVEVNGRKISGKRANEAIPASENELFVHYDWFEKDLMIVSLKEGMNIITVNKNNAAEMVLNLDYAYLYTESDIQLETREFSNYAFDCNDNKDPYKAEHGGSIEDPDYTYKKEGSANLYRYGNLNDALLTVTLVTEEKTVGLLRFINDCRPGRTFSFRMGKSENPYISSFTIDGQDDRHVSSSKSYPSIGWNQYRQEELAYVSLNAGENVIQFRISGDNINSCGVAIDAPVEVKIKNQQPDPTPEDPTKQKLEVEDALIDTNITVLGVGYEGKTPEQTNNPSGTGFLYNVNKSGYAIITFNFTASKETTATFGMCFGRREYALAVSDMYIITVNGEPCSADDITIPVKQDGGVLYYDWFEQDINTVNLKNGLNKITLIKVDNAPKVLNLDYIYLNTDAEITMSNMQNYRFDVNDAIDPSNEQNEMNPFIGMNGGSRNDSDGTYATESYNLYRYGSGNNAELSVTVVSNKQTTAIFKLINDCRPSQGEGYSASVFSYNQQPKTNKNNNPYITNFKVNGQASGFTPSNEKYASKGWNVFMECELAAVNLNIGENVISFKIVGDNINYCGIAVESEGTITLGGSGPTINKYVFNTNDATDPSIEENDHNPFAAMNGGSVEDSNKNYKAETGDIYRYGNGCDAIVTVSIVSSSEENVMFKLINDCRPGKTFSYSQISSGQPYISSLTVNGETNGITPSTTQYPSQGWNVFMECELATIHLQTGVNTIVFQIGGDNINYCGIVVVATGQIALNHQ